MTDWKFRARDSLGVTVKGTLEAPHSQALRDLLARQGLDLVRAQPARKGVEARHLKLPAKALPQVLRDIATIDESGVPLIQGLSDIAGEGDRAKDAAVLLKLKESVQLGKSLSEAMQEMPRAFSREAVATTRAGEKSGTLGTVLHRLADHLAWKREIASKAKQIAIYPTILAAAIGGLVVLMLTFLIPRMTAVFVQMNVDLPTPTRWVMKASDLLMTRWPVLLCGVVLLVVALVMLRASPRGRQTVDRWSLRFPLVGPILTKIGAGQVCASLANLFRAGLTLPECLEITEEVVPNRELARIVGNAREEVLVGSSLAKSFEEAQVLPPLVTRMIQLGENTGTLEESMERVVRIYDREIPTLVRRLVGFIEPITILCGGAAVAFVMISALLPIFRLMKAMR